MTLTAHPMTMTLSARPLRVCIIASSRFPIREPFEGGLEAHTATLARELMDRGHEVSVFAAPGSDPSLNISELSVAPMEFSRAARQDVGARPEEWMQEHHAYLSLMLQLSTGGARRFDVIHNNSLHHLPVAMAGLVGVPMVTTLHTPPTPWLESAMTIAGSASTFVAVSRHTAEAWSHVTPAAVVLNGVDTSRWSPGAGGGGAVWSGRIVPEKAPHLALAAARRAGIDIDLAGPVMDRGYFDREIAPMLGPGARYVGHLRSAQLVRLVGAASVAVVSPVWDEPYGLVAAEAAACGTPVAAFGRGALPEVVDPATGVLARPGSVASLAAAIDRARTLDRRRVRDHAITHLGLGRMVSDYEDVYAAVCARGVAA